MLERDFPDFVDIHDFYLCYMHLCCYCLAQELVFLGFLINKNYKGFRGKTIVIILALDYFCTKKWQKIYLASP